MAWLEHAPSNGFKIAFRLGDRKYKRSLNTSNPQLAEKARLRVEKNLRLVEQGRLDVPAGADLVEFLLYDGKLILAPHNGVDLAHLANTADSNRYVPPRPLPATQVSRSKSLGAILDEYYPKPDENSFVPETLRDEELRADNARRNKRRARHRRAIVQ
jgi:hypothetical protein